MKRQRQRRTVIHNLGSLDDDALEVYAGIRRAELEKSQTRKPGTNYDVQKMQGDMVLIEEELRWRRLLNSKLPSGA